MPYGLSGGGTLKTASFTITATPQKVLSKRDANPGVRVGWRAQNQGAVDVYWSSDPSVAASGAHQGFLLKGGQIPPTEFNDITINGEIWMVTASSTSVVIVGEIFPGAVP